MKVYTTEKKNKLSAAWLGFDGDRLYLNYKKSVNALQNVRQGVSNVLERKR
jgi:hypothetical protein